MDDARLRKLHVEQARETVRAVQAGIAGESARLRITHIVEERVPRVNGLRPHVHAYVGATFRSAADGTGTAVDAERPSALAGATVVSHHRDGLAEVTAAHCGLEW